MIFPSRQKKRKCENVQYNISCSRDGIKILIKKRTQKDIWQGLYDFPLLEQKRVKNFSIQEQERGRVEWVREDGQFKHVLSHQRIQATFWLVKCEDLRPSEGEIMIHKSKIEDYPLPQLLIRYVRSTTFFGGE